MTVDAYRVGGGNRYYLSLATLESVYGEYGFTASMVSSEDDRIFPHTDRGSSTIWFDAAPVQSGGLWWSPIGNKTPLSYDVYYTPYTESKGSGPKANYVVESCCVYSVSVVDEDAIIYTPDNLPAPQYYLRGSEVVLDLDYGPDYGVIWRARTAGHEVVEGVDIEEEGVTRITIPSIESSYVAWPRLSGQTSIVYVVDDGFEQCGQSYPANVQAWIESQRPTVGGQGEYHQIIDSAALAAGVQVMAPDVAVWQSRANYGQKGDMLFTYTFRGWDVTYTDATGQPVTERVQPGYVISAEDVERWQNAGVVHLVADWSAHFPEDDGEVNSVGFFVIVESLLDLTEGGMPNTGAKNYSDCLYSTTVLSPSGAGLTTATATTEILKNEADIRAVDRAIRSMVDVPVISATHGEFSLASFPSDEEILARLRTWAAERIQAGYDGKKTVTLDGVDVPLDQLTSDNFTIRWYVFKYDTTDGYHVDGVLVPKEAEVVVTKTFDGDAAAVQEIKTGGYRIYISRPDAAKGTVSVTLNLEPKTDANPYGYDAYDAASDTYTWRVGIRQQTTYTIEEQNHTPAVAADVASAHQYMVSGSAAATGGWRTLPENGITFTGEAYAVGTPVEQIQTIAFRNTYVSADTLTLYKLDAMTGNPLPGVVFTLTQDEAGQTPLTTLYQSLADPTQYYLYKPEGVEVTQITDGRVRTGSAGELFIAVEPMSPTFYTLIEDAPEGYTPADPIAIEHVEDDFISATGNPDDFVSENGVLTVKNRSSVYIPLTVTKDWQDGTNKQVTFATFANGRSASSVLPADSQAVVALGADGVWSHTYPSVPLYVDGAPASYSVRETWIGNPNAGGVAYDPAADADGYADYIVTTDRTVYSYADGTMSTRPFIEAADGTRTYPVAAEIVVHNRQRTASIELEKVGVQGEPLQGARFGIEKRDDRGLWQPFAIGGVSEYDVDAEGRISFVRLTTGTYRITEVAAPAGYYGARESMVVAVNTEAAGSKVSVISATSGLWTLEQASEDGLTSTLRVVNVPGFELPNTGGAGVVPMALAGLGLVAVALVLVWRRATAASRRL